MQRAHGAVRQHDNLTRLDVADEFRADNIQRAGFRTQNMRAVQFAQHQRAHAQRVARTDDRVIGQADEGIRAFNLAQRIDKAVLDGGRFAARNQVGDDFGIGRGLKQAAAMLQFFAKRQCVGQIAVMANSKAAEFVLGEQRLHVAQNGLAGGGVTRVTNSGVALQPLHDGIRVEVLRNVPQAPVRIELLPVEADHACGLLASVLQGVHPQRGMRGGLRVADNAEDPALFLQMIVVI